MNSHVFTIEFATLIWAFVVLAAIFYSFYSKTKDRGYILDKRLK